MMGRRRRRQANIDPTLVQCLVFEELQIDLCIDNHSRGLLRGLSGEGADCGHSAPLSASDHWSSERR